MSICHFRPCMYLSDPPEYANTASIRHFQLMVGDPFSMNCTPSDANPPVHTIPIEYDGESSVVSDDTATVTDNVLTIPSVQRSHSGNYSCNATNTVGNAVIYTNLLVVGTYYRMMIVCIVKFQSCSQINVKESCRYILCVNGCIHY